MILVTYNICIYRVCKLYVILWYLPIRYKHVVYSFNNHWNLLFYSRGIVPFNQKCFSLFPLKTKMEVNLEENCFCECCSGVMIMEVNYTEDEIKMEYWIFVGFFFINSPKLIFTYLDLSPVKYDQDSIWLITDQWLVLQCHTIPSSISNKVIWNIAVEK